MHSTAHTSEVNHPHYLSVILSRGSAGALFLEVEDGLLRVASHDLGRRKGRHDFPVLVDTTLQHLGSKSESVDTTIFCVPHSWSAGNEVTDEWRDEIESITNGLQLSALGFVDQLEALITAGASEPITTVLVVISVDAVEVAIVKQSQLTAVTSVGRSNDVAADCLEALARITRDDANSAVSLPNTMQLASYDMHDEQLRDLQQELLAFDWESQEVFSAMPSVDVIPQREAVHRLVRHMADVFELEADSTIPDTVAPTPPAVEPEDTVPLAAASSTDGSFSTVTADQQETILEQAAADSHQDWQDDPEENEESEADVNTAVNTARTGWLNALMKRASHHHFALVGFIGGVLALLGIGGFVLWQSLQAQVVITPALENVSTDATIAVVARGAGTDESSATTSAAIPEISAEVVTSEVSGSESKDTTGATLVGEKAEGSVELSNKTETKREFDAGTVLLRNGQEFELIESVEIASASVEESDDEETKTFGKASARIRALEIGAEGNLNPGEELRITDVSSDEISVIVSGEEGLTGGFSREVRVVSESDRSQLQQALRGELRDQALESLMESAAENENIIPVQGSTISSSDFSEEVGAEVDTLSLDLSVSVQGFRYNTTDVKPLVETLLQEKVEEGRFLLTDDPQILIDSSSTASSSTRAVIETNVSAETAPQLNFESWRSEIAGKRAESAAAILRGKSEIDSVTIQLQPAWIQYIWNRLPKDTERVILQNNLLDRYPNQKTQAEE